MVRMAHADPIGWARSRAERRLHPVRWKCRRIALHILVWIPSLAAGWVLFFFPIATHLVHPSSQYLQHYRVPIPWTFMIIPVPGPLEDTSGYYVIGSRTGMGRFGLSPTHLLLPPLYIFREKQLSWITFMNYPGYSLEATVDDAKTKGVDLRVLTRKFGVGSAELTCWQFRPYSPRGLAGWSVFCRTTANIPRNDFSATFNGREEELNTFYDIVGGIRPLE